MIEGFTAPDLKQARAQGFQVALAVSLYGVSFGALSVALGFTLWQTMVLSLVMFSGASQFAFIGVVATGGLSAIPAAIATSGLLGARNSLYALTMSPIIGKGFFRRALAAHLTVDETTAVATAQTGRLASQHGFWAPLFGFMWAGMFPLWPARSPEMRWVMSKLGDSMPSQQRHFLPCCGPG